jgi:hypothetical protein
MYVQLEPELDFAFFAADLLYNMHNYVTFVVFYGSLSRDRCYDFKNILAEKIVEKIGVCC